jgi:hypothetical protein
VIRSRQNEQRSIQLIASFRRLYTIAKKYNNGYVMLNVVFMTIITVLSVLANSEAVAAKLGFVAGDYSSWVAVAAITVMMLEKLLITDRIDQARELAAKIQDLFDRELFGLVWNTTLAGDEPRIGDIVRHGDWYLEKNGAEKLDDWYSLSSADVPHLSQVLICQNSSLYWDASLRKRINFAVVLVGVAIVTGVLGISVYLNLSTTSVIVNITALLGPIVEYGYSTLKQNNESIAQSERLLGCIQDGIKLAEKGDNEADLLKSIEAIQAQLFNKRKSDWLIPDLFYALARDGDEKVMVATSSQLEKKLRKR